MYYASPSPHGGDLSCPFDFSANVNPLGPSPAALSAARAALAEADRYPDPHCAALVRAIAGAEGVPEDFVLCGAGASELLYHYFAALGPVTGLSPAPCFGEYAAALALAGGRMEYHVLRWDNGFLLTEDFPRRVRQTRPGAAVLCDPNNPTGRRVDPELLRETLAACETVGARLLVDECFLPLSGDGAGAVPWLAAHPALAVLRAFTKTHGLAGLRLGYLLSADSDLLRRMSALAPPWNVSGVAQAAGVAALGDRDYLARSRAFIRAERTLLREGLEALGLRVCPSEANFLLISGPAGLVPKLKRHGVALRDCAAFPGLGEGWYRAAVRPEPEREALIEALEEELMVNSE